MTTQISLTYCGMDGTGAGVKAAKQDAARKIETLIADIQRGPRMLHIGESLGIVYRDVWGWCYQIAGGIYASECKHSGYTTADEASMRCFTHVAQLVWSHDVTDDRTFFDALADGLRLPRKELNRAITEAVWHAEWQRKYKAARDAGHTDVTARDIASGLHA